VLAGPLNKVEPQAIAAFCFFLLPAFVLETIQPVINEATANGWPTTTEATPFVKCIGVQRSSGAVIALT
jgi:hypothetical protein